MATLKAPFALDRSLNTTEENSRNIADVLAEGLSHITGRTASEVEYDNTDSGLTSDDVQGAIDELSERPTLPSVDVQTAVDEFETYNGGLLSECKVTLEPVQSGSGDPSPDNVRPITGHTEVKVGDDGKNKLNITASETTTQGITFTPQSDGGIRIKGTNTNTAYFYPIGSSIPATWLNKSFIVSGGKDGVRVRAYHYDGTNNVYSENGAETSAFTFTSASSVIDIYVPSGTTVDTVIYPMLRLASDTDPTYVPYNGYQITVNLGGTYYSGTLDVVTGVFTPDTAEVDLGTLTYSRTEISGVGYRYYASDLSDIIKKTTDVSVLPNIVCEQYAPKLPSQYNQAVDGITVYTNGSIQIYDSTRNTLSVSDFKTAMSGVQLVYELATPTSIQLSPTMVKALVGENHLSAPLDGQEITESKYRELFTWDEVEAYVNAHSGSGMNYSTEEQVVGTWFGKTLYQKTVDQTIGSDADYTVFTNGIDHAHLVNSSFEYSSGRWMSFDYISLGGASNNRTCYVDVQNGALNLHNQSNSSIHWIATIQYTKTTD